MKSYTHHLAFSSVRGVLSAAVSKMSGDWGDAEASSVAGSNVDVAAAASSAVPAETGASTAASALAQAALRQFSPELTTKIFDLLCDESVSCP